MELTINTTVKRATGMSPFMLAHGREAVFFNMHLLPALKQNLTDAALEAAAEGGGTLTVPMSASMSQCGACGTARAWRNGSDV